MVMRRSKSNIECEDVCNLTIVQLNSKLYVRFLIYMKVVSRKGTTRLVKKERKFSICVQNIIDVILAFFKQIIFSFYSDLS